MNQKRRATIIFLIAFSTVVLWLCYLIARPFLKPVFLAVVLAIVFRPAHLKIRKFVRNANVSALVSTLCALLAITVPALLLGAALRKELASAYQSLTAGNAHDREGIAYLLQLIEKAWQWLGKYVDLSQVDLRAELIDRLQQLSAFLLSNIAGVAGGVTSLAVAAVTTFLTLFYLFRDGQALWRRLAVLVPLNPSQLEKLTDGVSRTIRASMYGVLAVAFIQGLLLGLAFWVLGLPSPVLWGLAAAIFSLIPVVGTGAVWLPATIILVLTGHWGKGLILLGWGAGVVGMADNIVRPLVISDQIHVHPLYFFFALLGGVQAFGLSGLFIGPVVFALAQGLVSVVRDETRAHTNHTVKESPNADV